MGKVILINLILAGGIYLLYVNGYLVVNAKSAVSFVGSKRGNQATFSSCTGYIKRVVRFRADKTYTVTLETKLAKGDLTVTLLDASKQEIMCLNSCDQSAAIAVEKKKRYYLIVRFKAATGTYVLSWD